MPETILDPEVLNAEDEDVRPPTHGALVPVGLVGPLQSRSLPALATMSDEDFEILATAGAKLRERIQIVHRKIMQEDVDYGVIPGTKRPTLLKSGAEVLTKFLHGTARFSPPLVTERGTYLGIMVCCKIVDEGGAILGEGWGDCNSWEPKYRWRDAQPTCPECGVQAIFRSKFEEGFYCWKKREGCGAQFDAQDERITSQPIGKVENADPYGLKNTLLKMAQKRAHVAAALNGACASGTFTQDLEEDVPPKTKAKDEPTDEDAVPPRAGAAAKQKQGPADAVFLRGAAKVAPKGAQKAKAMAEAKPAEPAQKKADDSVDDDFVGVSVQDLRAQLKQCGCKNWGDVRQFLGKFFAQEKFVLATGQIDLALLTEVDRHRAKRWMDDYIGQQPQPQQPQQPQQAPEA